MEETPKSQLSVRVPAELHQKVKVWCVMNRTSVQDFVAEALELLLSEKSSPIGH